MALLVTLNPQLHIHGSVYEDEVFAVRLADGNIYYIRYDATSHKYWLDWALAHRQNIIVDQELVRCAMEVDLTDWQTLARCGELLPVQSPIVQGQQLRMQPSDLTDLANLVLSDAGVQTVTSVNVRSVIERLPSPLRPA